MLLYFSSHSILTQRVEEMMEKFDEDSDGMAEEMRSHFNQLIEGEDEFAIDVSNMMVTT